jgi:exonuclease III
MTVIPPHTQFSLNIRGLVDTKSREAKIKWLRWLIREYKPDMIHFQEHHCSSMKEVMTAFRQLGGKVVGVSLAPNKGSYTGVLTYVPPKSVLYDMVGEHSVSQDGRHAMIKITATEEVRHILNIYAPAQGKAYREAFFDGLSQLPKMDEPSLMAVGDWNYTTDRLDRLNVSGHVEPEPHPKSVKFLLDVELIDTLRYRDDEIVTMTYSMPSQNRWARLDRWYTQPDLLDESTVLPTISAAAVSDHDVIRLQYGNPYKSPKPTNPIYRMSVSLIKQLGMPKSKVRQTVERLITEHEALIEAEDDPAKVLALYDTFKETIRLYFKRCDDKYKRARKSRLKEAIKLAEFEIGPNAPVISIQLAQKEVAKNYIKDSQRRVIENIQLKSAFNWTRDGEQSNKLFFKATKQRTDCAGIPDVKYKTFTSNSHFSKKLLIGMSFAETFGKRTPDQQDLTKVLDAIRHTQTPGKRMLTPESIERLNAALDLKTRNKEEPEDPEDDWLIQTIMSLKMYKAAGPDGIPNEFYYLLRENTGMIGILKKTFEKSLELGVLPSSMRETYYKLLYKKATFTTHEINTGAFHGTANDPRLLTNWRPIALLPCDSKILSTYIANKLKIHMDSVITRAQSAFVPGRSILDNIMLVLQVIHHHMQTNKGAGLLFLDFAHAYDYISQEYILEVLGALDFPPSLLNAIKMMMTDQTGRVIVNNDLTWKFNVLNGGKQGDPLFPLVYIAALEGLYALMDTHPDFQGIKIPSQGIPQFLKYLGYADDTAVAIGDQEEGEALEDIFKVFEQASGNEIKAAKSYIMWLGEWITSSTTIYDIPVMQKGSTERYLGIIIGHYLSSIDQWSSTTQKLQHIFQYWNSFGLSVFGRNLLINSRMLSQIWFKGSVLPITIKQQKQLDAPVNHFFRKGKRNNSVPHATRVLPTTHGGLGQINIPTQMHLLRTKWIVRYEAGDNPLWTQYWAENVRKLKAFLGTETDLRVYSCNWNKLRATARNGIFLFVLEAYKSWHAQGFKIQIENFETVSSQPLIDNKYIMEEQLNIPLKATDDMTAVLKHLDSLRVGHFFEEASPEPSIPFNSQDPDTWRYHPKDPPAMNQWSRLNFPHEVWEDLFELLPGGVMLTMVKGSAAKFTGWAAIQYEPEGHDEYQPLIGDIYYIPIPDKGELSIMYFEDREGILTYVSTSKNSNWGDWQTQILPNLRPLEVSCVSGHPRVLGWADQIITNNTFQFPVERGPKETPKTIETVVASATYTLLNESQIIKLKCNLKMKPNFSALNKKLRHCHSKPLKALEMWQPTEREKSIHNTKIKEKKIPPGTPCTINWQLRMQKIINCPFVLPKYRQFIYWITTGTLCTGKVLRHYTDRGDCPNCGVTASWQHMFFYCESAKAIWEEIDILGHSHWDEYIPLVKNDVPTIINDYDPIRLFHLSTLWAMWVHWCKYFHNPEDFTDDDLYLWINIVIISARDQLRMRVQESFSAVQWLRIVEDRRIHSQDKAAPVALEAKAPEKEFLLVHSQNINTNAEFVTINGFTPREIEWWYGNNVLVKLDGNIDVNPRMVFNYHPWDPYTRPPDHEYPSDYEADSWSLRPQHCLMDY